MLELVMRLLFISTVLYSIFFTLKRSKRKNELFSRFDEALKVVEKDLELKEKEKNAYFDR